MNLHVNPHIGGTVLLTTNLIKEYWIGNAMT